MIQLRVYEEYVTPWTSASPKYLDLYETQPIKLNLSIEDITNADATSTFSRTFRVPATRQNNEFFENAWDIDGLLFDVTVKKPAQILVDGAEFKVGHIRLQKVFLNEDQDRIDYELLFLGETRDFSSIVAEKPMCQLVMTDFDWPNNPVAYTNAADFVGPFTYNDITLSWNAFPENASLTAGYADGDLLFPLIDHGNTYDDQGNPEQGVISIAGTGRFTQSQNALALDRFKPMIRAKRLWDQIFEDSGYTYTSTFLNSDRFHQMYVSAFGNEEQIGMNIGQTTTTIFQSSNSSNTDNAVGDYMYNNNITSNVGGYFTQATGITGSYFTAPGTASLGGNYYLFNVSAEVDAQIENSNYTYSPVPCAVQLVVVNTPGGTIQQTLATGNFTFGMNTSSISYDSRNGGYQIQQGDILQVLITASGAYDIDQVDNTYWDCTAAPGDYYAPADLNCDYRQIDYIKDVLTMFRLVMQPDKNNPYNFIIEPWQDFIGSGTVYDWSDKLIREKDFVMEPLFNTQSAEIEFTKIEDEDWINTFHQDNNKHPYGWLRFDSGNELLKGTRNIELIGISPTPIDQIETGANAPHPFPGWVLPLIHKHEDDTAALEHIPIKPNTRFLFYNGQQPITVIPDDWYMLNDTGNAVLQSTWPLVSSYENWPVQQSSLNLNFSNDTRYYIDPSPGTGYFDQGSTLFDEYWSRYISSLYNKFSRRVTAYFTLNNVDLQDLTFDDLIFIDGKYYRPEKIIDVQIGERTAVKCQLITYKDQRPVWIDEPLTGFSVVVTDGLCFGEQGNIQVTTNGTPNFTWELEELGITGTYSAPIGQAPYIFNITNVPLGTHTLIVTDSVGRTAQVVVQVNVSSATPVLATASITQPTDCEAPCNGEITVTPSGGNGAPYTIVWNDGGTGFTRTGLCPGDYLYYVTDSLGCQSETLLAPVRCTVTQNSFVVRECPNGQIDYYADYPGQLSQGDVVTLDNLAGCYFVFGSALVAPQYSIVNTYADCPTCEAANQPQQSWKVADCDTGTDIRYVNDDWNLIPGQAIRIDEQGNNTCYEVIEGSPLNYNHDVNEIFDNCASCQIPGYQYYGVFCDGSAPPVYFNSSIALALNTTYVVLDGPYVGKCVTIVLENPGATTFGNLDTSTVYDDCESCEGQVTTATCHTIQNTGGTTASGTFDRGGNTFTWSIAPGVTTQRCGDAGSFSVDTGTATITDSGISCVSDTDCTRYTATCHQFDGGTLNPTGYTEFTYIDGAGNPQTIKIPDGRMSIHCAQVGSVIVVTGNGTATNLGNFCSNDQSCF